MFKSALVAGALAGLALVVPPATARPDRTHACRPGVGARDGRCVDPVGDVQGAAGPDIVRVDELEWGTLVFVVTFARTGPSGFPLTHAARYDDQVSVTMTAQGSRATKRYRLTLSAGDPKHEILQRLPEGKLMLLPLGARPKPGNAVGLVLDLRPFVGGVRAVRYTVEAARVMRNGTVVSRDVVPNKGTMTYYGNGL